jgi:hypothetical protein
MRVVLILGVAAYLQILTNVYIERISVTWAYEGLRYSPPPAGLQSVTWVLAFLPALWLPVALNRPSQVVYWFVYVVVYVPTCVLTLFSSTIQPELLVRFLVCLAICFFGLGQIYRLPLLQLPQCVLPPLPFWAAMAAFGLVCYAVILSVSGLHLSLVSIEDVYGLRSDYESAVDDFGPILGYVVTWQVSLINPFLIAYGLARKSGLWLALGVGAQVLMYAITGFKLALFSGGIMAFILLALVSRGRWFGIWLLAAVVALIVFAVDFDALTESNLWTALLVNRTFALPGVLTGYYFEFFTRNPQALLGDSIFRTFVRYPYDVGIPAVIGSMYPIGTWANANFWADAYANFGYVGLFVFTFLLAVVLHAFDSVSERHGLVLPALLSANAASILVNGALLTSLLTNGLGFMIALLYVMPRTETHRISRHACATRSVPRVADS